MRASERRLARLWRDEGPRLPPLGCDDGTRVRVLYPGCPSSEAGPDFRDAILVTEKGRVLRGDVELHLRAAGWQAHGHHRDHRYNNVVLHVTLWPAPTGGPEARLEMGVRVPTTSLFPVLARGTRRSPGPPAVPLPFAGVPQGGPAALLDQAGEARFREKVRALTRALDQAIPRRTPLEWTHRASAAQERLYQGLMEALGYARNRGPFLTLALGVPLSLLERGVRGTGAPERALALQALLWGGAGFLEGPAQTPGASTPSLLERWQATGLSPVVPPEAWHLFRVRPDNSPRRRLAGMALLLDRFWEQGLLATLTGLVKEGTVSRVSHALTVASPQAGPECAMAEGTGRPGPALIGAGRAGEMAVNVLLPFCAAWGLATRDRGLRNAAATLYRQWPALPENEITREVATRLAQGGGAGGLGPPSARRQQGMLHLYRHWLGAGR